MHSAGLPADADAANGFAAQLRASVALDRFAYIAQPRDFEIAARCVENFVPVVEDYQNVCIIETGMTFA